MSRIKKETVYQKISKISGIAIPVLYVFAGSISAFLIFIIFHLFTGSGDFKLTRPVELDIMSLDFTNRVVLTFLIGMFLIILLRIFWFLLKVAKRFKVGDIFSDETARYAHSAAFNLLILHVMGFTAFIYIGLLTGEIMLGIPIEVVSILFAYLFAWVLKIGSQLKAENDLTV